MTDLLITGGTGSFGRKLADNVLAKYKVRKLIIFSRDELKQLEMQRIHPHGEPPPLRYFLGNVRDEARLNEAFHQVDYVVHAAALK